MRARGGNWLEGKALMLDRCLVSMVVVVVLVVVRVSGVEKKASNWSSLSVIANRVLSE